MQEMDTMPAPADYSHQESCHDSTATAIELAESAVIGDDFDDALPDIGVASFGGTSAEAVFEPDDRVRLTTTDQLPWRVNTSLRITAADGSQWIGTGWFISPRTLLTAGHCVFINGSSAPGRNGWVRSIVAMPGRNETNLPFGALTAATFRSVDDWTQHGDERYDYGAIVLPAPFAATIGVYRLGLPEHGPLSRDTFPSSPGRRVAPQPSRPLPLTQSSPPPHLHLPTSRTESASTDSTACFELPLGAPGCSRSRASITCYRGRRQTIP